MTGNGPLLTVDDLAVHYRGRRRQLHKAVDQVSFDIRPGETVGLVGESGSGKSTIARAILGLAPVTAGTVAFDGRDITRAGFAERRRLSADLQAVFQDPTSSLNPSRTIGSTLAEPLLAQGVRGRDEINRRVGEMLERVGLSPEAAARHPARFSGGQRQRIGIARALMTAPRLVICDEVVSALDLSVQAQVLNLLRELQRDQRLSYLFISHDLEVVRHLCDRVLVLYRGRLVETGPATTVSARPAHPYTDALHKAAPVLDPRVQRERRLAAAAAAPPEAHGSAQWDGCAFRPRCAFADDLCRTETPLPRDAGHDITVACHHYPAWQDRPVLATTQRREA
ncbi:ABC transporter ATP-binding protein [Streptomyces sp. NPDC091217]|uniref:ABC transporter ATP-binding protein n=1 Tax=Streptomyces sp. NPDC091217 TaxID=3365975 RepID=UPI0038061D9C